MALQLVEKAQVVELVMELNAILIWGCLLVSACKLVNISNQPIATGRDGSFEGPNSNIHLLLVSASPFLRIISENVVVYLWSYLPAIRPLGDWTRSRVP